jgi:L-Ala-D/L-Glu epimerase
VKLHFSRVDLQLANTWTIARGSTDVFPVIIVELTDADGVTGRGEASPVERYGESVSTVESFLQRVDAERISFADVPGSMQYLELVAPGNSAAKCALNTALLDGAARRVRLPLHVFLGLNFRENHHVTSFSIGIAKPDEIRNKVHAAEQFPILKLKVGSPDDKSNLKALREVAPHKLVRVDANEGWKTKELALEMINWLASDGRIELIEQPMPASTPPRDLAWLKQRSPLPLFGDESYHAATDAARCVECFHGVNVKLVKSQGVSGGLEALRAARNVGLKTMLGCMIETSVLISAAAHLAELCDYLDLDGNLLVTNDPFNGVAAEKGILSFSAAVEPFGLRVSSSRL